MSPPAGGNPRDLLFHIRGELESTALEVMERKNAHYATGGDPILNYRRAAEAAGTTPAQFIVGRWQEKITRIGNLLRQGPEAHDLVREELHDPLNFPALIAFAMEMDEGGTDGNS